MHIFAVFCIDLKQNSKKILYSKLWIITNQKKVDQLWKGEMRNTKIGIIRISVDDNQNESSKNFIQIQAVFSCKAVEKLIEVNFVNFSFSSETLRRSTMNWNKAIKELNSDNEIDKVWFFELWI